MAKPRGSTSYRLSGDAQQLLSILAGRLGLTKTGVLEMAIRKLAYAEVDEDSLPASFHLHGRQLAGLLVPKHQS